MDDDDGLTLDDILHAVPVNSRDYRRYKARSVGGGAMRDLGVTMADIDSLERVLRDSPQPMGQTRIARALGISENRAAGIIAAASFVLPVYDSERRGIGLLGVHDSDE